MQRPEPAVVNCGPQLAHWVVVAVLQHDAERKAARVGGRDHAVRICKRERDRFLNQHVFSGVERVERHLGVKPTGNANAHRVNVGPVEQRAIVGIRVGPRLGGEACRPALLEIGHCHEPRIGKLRQRMSVARRNAPASNQPKPQDVRGHQLSPPERSRVR